MELTDFIMVGLLQGVTEWLPISSSGQSMLALINFLSLNPETALKLAIYLHTGTLLAVSVKYRRDLLEVLKSIPGLRDDRLTLFLVVSTLISALIGAPIYILMRDYLRYYGGGGTVTVLIGFSLLFTGALLYLSKERFGVKKVRDVRVSDMIVCGIAQGLSVIPGISRSGVTVSAMLLVGFRQDIALKLSFLMSIPAVFGVVFVEYLSGDIVSLNYTGLFTGILVAFIAGYLTIEALLLFSRRVRFDFFCIFFGLLTIALTGGVV